MEALIAGLALVLFGLFYVMVFPIATIACMAWVTAGKMSLPKAALRCGLLMPVLLVVFTPVRIEPVGLVCWWLLHLQDLFGPIPLVIKNHAALYPESITPSLMVCVTLAGMVLYYRALTGPGLDTSKTPSAP